MQMLTSILNDSTTRQVTPLYFTKLRCCFIPQVHIQNASLAGAVAMGTAAEFMITPYGSLIVGFCMGIISTFGYLFVTVSTLLLFVYLCRCGYCVTQKLACIRSYWKVV